MGSHDRDNEPPLQDLSPGIREKGVQWTQDEALEAEQTPQRISPARRFIFSFLLCSLVLFGLASVHSPRLWQRISCHNGRMANQKVDAEMETESKPPAIASVPDQASPEPLNELLYKYFPGLDAAHVDRAQTPSMLRMAKRDTNSSSVPARSAEPSSTPEPEPSSSVPAPSSDPPTSEPPPSQTPPPSPSSTFSTSTTQPTTPSTKPPPVTSKPTPTPTSSNTPPSTSDDDDNDNDDETTITTRPVSPTSHPPVPPKVIVETSTRTSNGQVVIVESTITVQPSATGPKPVTESTKPPPSLQNAATRQETRGMVLSVLAVGAVMGALLV